MEISFRYATPDDYPAILDMIKELALFEKAPEKVTNTVEQMNNEDHLFHCILAENQEHGIVGMALYFYAYFTWVGKSMYLDDLYIKEKFRAHGIGSRLLEEIFNEAKSENCKRLRWQVLDWNRPAIELYKKIGATLDNEWINCDFDSNGIDYFCASLK